MSIPNIPPSINQQSCSIFKEFVRKWQIPNIITFIRLVLCWLPGYCLYQHELSWAFFAFIFLSFSDFVDGWLARWASAMSNFGKLADPIADLLLVSATLFGMCLAAKSLLAGLTWGALFAVNTTRGIYTIYLREVGRRKNIIIPANKNGKTKMVLQIAGILIALLPWNFCSIAGALALTVATIFSMVAAVQYKKAFIKASST